jgi:hypothetical protein
MTKVELDSIIEEVSKSVHDAWQQERTRQGWTYGPVRDDSLKQSPAMKPYDELSDDVKELDRVSVRATLKALLDLGYDVREKQ